MKHIASETFTFSNFTVREMSLGKHWFLERSSPGNLTTAADIRIWHPQHVHPFFYKVCSRLSQQYGGVTLELPRSIWELSGENIDFC